MNSPSDNTAVPEIDAADTLVRRVAGFQAYLRAHGFQSGIPESRDALVLASAVDVTDRYRLRSGLKCLLCNGQGEWSRFDELFDAYWLPPNRSVLRDNRAPAGATRPESNLAATPPKGLLTDVQQGAGDAGNVAGDDAAPVSYTHLTLPTNREV